MDWAADGKTVMVLIIKILILAELQIQASANFQIFCYMTSSSRRRDGIGKFGPENVDPFLCTHIVYAFAGFDGDGNVIPWKYGSEIGDYRALAEKKKENSDLKLLLAVGGWSFGGKKFSDMAANPVTRKTFIQSVLDFLRQYEFDGIDINWEFPVLRGGKLEDRENLVILFKELHEAFTSDGTHQFLLTAAVPSQEARITAGYNVKELERYLDFVNLMTFDFHGGWEKKTGHNSPLFRGPFDSSEDLNIQKVVSMWYTRGMPKNKILVGMPTYGLSFTLMNENAYDVGSPASTGVGGQVTGNTGFWAYFEICQERENDGGRIIFDGIQKVPYYVKKNLWISFDNKNSFQIKAEWVKSNSYGGVSFWALDYDDYNKICQTSSTKYPLIRSVVDILNAPTVVKQTSSPVLITTPPPETNFKPNANSKFRVVCYYNSWSKRRYGIGKFSPENVDPFLCTHIIYAFAIFNDSGEVIPSNPLYDIDDFQSLADKKKRNAKLKLLLAVGGRRFGSKKFSDMAASPAKRNTFIQSVLRFLRQYSFNGLDINWEYPASRDGKPEDRENLVTLLKELSEAFKKDAANKYPEYRLLTIATPANVETASKGYNIPALQKYVDFVNLMTYDFHGPWEKKTGFNSPLFGRPNDANFYLSIDSAASWWRDSGMPKSKIVVGFSTYGLSFTLANILQNEVGAASWVGAGGPSTGRLGFWAYYDICLEIQKYTGKVIFDAVQKVPYYVENSLWISFDNEQSLEIKAQWVMTSGYGGASFWSLDSDDFNRACTKLSLRTYPLIRIVADIFSDSQETSIVTTPTTTNERTPIPTTKTTTTTTRTTTETAVTTTPTTTSITTASTAETMPSTTTTIAETTRCTAPSTAGITPSTTATAAETKPRTTPTTAETIPSTTTTTSENTSSTRAETTHNTVTTNTQTTQTTTAETTTSSTTTTAEKTSTTTGETKPSTTPTIAETTTSSTPTTEEKTPSNTTTTAVTTPSTIPTTAITTPNTTTTTAETTLRNTTTTAETTPSATPTTEETAPSTTPTTADTTASTTLTTAETTLSTTPTTAEPTPSTSSTTAETTSSTTPTTGETTAETTPSSTPTTREAKPSTTPTTAETTPSTTPTTAETTPNTTTTTAETTPSTTTTTAETTPSTTPASETTAETTPSTTPTTAETTPNTTTTTAETTPSTTPTTAETTPNTTTTTAETTPSTTPTTAETTPNTTTTTAETTPSTTPASETTAEPTPSTTPTTAETTPSSTPTTAETTPSTTPTTEETASSTTPTTAETTPSTTSKTAEKTSSTTPTIAETTPSTTPTVAETHSTTPTTPETNAETTPSTTPTSAETTPSTTPTTAEITSSTTPTTAEITSSTTPTTAESTPSTTSTTGETTTETAPTTTPTTSDTTVSTTPTT